MKNFKQTSAIALLLVLSGQAASQATTFNTTPLGANGHPIPAFHGNTTPLSTTGQPVPAFHGNTTPLSTTGQPVPAFHGNTTPLSTTGQPVPAFHGNTTPLGATGQPIPAFHGNTTPLGANGLPVTKTVVTTAAGLLAGGSTFAVPNVKATIATGPIPVPKPGTTTPQFGVPDDSGVTANPLASVTDLAVTPVSVNPAALQTTAIGNLGLTNIGFAQQQAAQSAGAIAGGAINGSFNNAVKGNVPKIDATNPTALQPSTPSVNPAALQPTSFSFNPASLEATTPSINSTVVKIPVRPVIPVTTPTQKSLLPQADAAGNSSVGSLGSGGWLSGSTFNPAAGSSIPAIGW
jgi:hypothetical protein